VLKTLGFSSLRDHQAKPIQLALDEQDQFVVLPTGAGKSAIYIIPALCCGFKTLVFSPLRALIKDQLDALQRAGLQARGITSDFQKPVNDSALRDWSTGSVDFLLVAPERTSNEDFLRAMRLQTPDFVVVDEIHVASEAAFNFRPDYKKIAPFVRELNPKLFLGLTATMPEEVEKDLRVIFNVPDIIKTESYYVRDNLEIESKEWTSPFGLLRELNSMEGSSIVYFSSVKKLEETYEAIGNQVEGGACIFHGSVASGSKVANQNAFMDNTIRVVFATNSFGMGVDKPDIRSVIFASIPGSIEELSQGFGRGGRDDKPCRCIFYWDENSIRVQEFFIDIGYPSKRDVTAFINAITKSMDANGICVKKNRELATMAGLHPSFSSAIVSILTSEGIVQRIKQEVPLRVRPLTTPEKGVMKETLEAVVMYGVRNEVDGFYDVNIDTLADNLSRTVPQVRRNLKTLENNSMITLESDVGAAKPLKLLRNPTLEDFEKIKARREAALRKLKEVGEFHRLPDSKKHDYLTQYFRTHG